MGLVLSVSLFTVAVGKVKRVAAVAGSLVPLMVLFYAVITGYLLLSHLTELPTMLALIVIDAFSGEAVSGGALGAVILVGVQRGVFSNEAGLGTESLAHGAAKTNEPTREGLVAMVGPIIDTLLVCTCTALAIMLSGVMGSGGAAPDGVTLTARAFGSALGGTGTALLFVCVVAFSLTTILTYSYYGTKCFAYLFGVARAPLYALLYVASLPLAAVVSLDTAINVIDGCFALMAIPTMVSALWLSPVVMREARAYFRRLATAESRAAAP